MYQAASSSHFIYPADNNFSICQNGTTLTKETATPASQQLYMEGYVVR
jgi:hypothetical protein